MINQLYYGSGHLYNQSVQDGDNITEIRHSERNQLHQETSRQQGELLSSFGYDAMGRLTKQYSSNHNKGRIVIERDYHYDVLGQLTHLSGQTHLNHSAKNISTANSLFKRNHQYQYDKVGRLTEHKLTDFIQQKGTTERFAFDPASNRVPVSTAVDKESSETNNAVNNDIHKSGRPTKLITADKLITYTYGIHGQVLFKTITPAKNGEAIPQSTNALVSSRKSIQHYYNPNNELIKTITNTEEGFTLTEVTTTYYYDAFGRRIAKASDTKVKTKFINSKHLKTVKYHFQKQKTKHTQIRYLWDGSRQAQEYTDTHVFTTVYEQDSFEPVARLVWLKDELLKAANDEIKNAEREAWEDAPELIPNMQVYYYHNDHLGTPNELTNTQGEVVWLADYQAWGNTAKVVWRKEKIEHLKVSADELQPIRFQGQSFDTETGLHYNRFRYYDPDLGMFISRDPIGLMGGSNTFAYAPNPTGWIDPFGLAKQTPNNCDCDDDNPCKGKNPSKLARSWQGNAPYEGKDIYKNVVVKKGTVLHTLYPHGPHTPNYFVKSGQMLSVSGARAYNDALQLSHSANTPGARPMRTQVRAFIVQKDTCMAEGRALANPSLGKGGGKQYFLPPSDTKNLVGTSKIIGL